ncbi:SHOCT domain-containing protein [Saccharopolyspora indica]|uniref:SHOCT domain-containing protein n=1 Tax=Saccharopolyspora indica TaxID=1229659 RepID=UPI0022EB75AA|nr:SHOCT domain-containing protein [Saccharopolyspora indica]MDA3644284.1 SHOCT domain-containing protein [Saccharopolyspora indica]
MHYWGDYGPSIWGMTMMTVSMVLFWALIIAAIVALVRYIGRTGRSEQRSTPAEEILAERYARGEIDDEEYRRRMQSLSERGHRRT